MRAVALLAALLILAGCSAPADEPSPTSSTGAPRQGRAVPGSGSDEPPHDDITVFTGPIDVKGQGPADFPVDVPANTTHLHFIIRSNNLISTDGLKVALDGCGAFDSGGGSYTGVGGTPSYTGTVCEGPASGSHTLTVSGTLLYMEGTIALLGWQPLGNATSAPQS
jgi:hypothetical protein